MVELVTEKEAFLQRYNITVESFESTKLEWNTLARIFSQYASIMKQLEKTGSYVLQRMGELPAVHSLKLRIKNPEHLVAKIIRKKIDKPELEFTADNYSELVTDLIGVRALHLFKDQWRDIHNFVTSTWELNEEPIAYVREGDPEPVLEDFRNYGCRVERHSFGYRSVHYALKCRPAKQLHIVELQVRTLFEEGWSEIDHLIRYPHNVGNPYLSDFLTIFNRLAGSADEMGTYIKSLRLHIAEQDEKLIALQGQTEQMVSELNISKAEKEKLQTQIKELRQSAQSRNITPLTVSSSSPPIRFDSMSPFAGTALGEIFGKINESVCISCHKPFERDYPWGTVCPDCSNYPFRLIK